jgi:hypothetical protein
MPPIRFRIRTIMIVIAALAVLMGMRKSMPRWSDSLVLPLKAIVVLAAIVFFFHRNRPIERSEPVQSGEAERV